jgi:ectoine hydroxylase-related dioxygenase (phytanoyl-CoA dioxygenase family)
VRIDNVLSAELADALRDYLCDLRARGTADIESGIITDSQERFADVLLNQNRCDLKIPLGPAPVNNALHHLLAMETSIVRDVMEYVFESYDGIGKDAELWELNCFMSNSGARRQLVHADNVCLEPIFGLKNEMEPIVLTCFIALQDIDETMGPTVWMPGTHTLQAHNQFFETGTDEASTPTDSYSPKDTILRSSKAVIGTIPKGACVIFDPRVLHCAGGNTCPDPEKTRALFYVSFKNPKIDNPGCPSTSGYGIATAEITMEDLTADLQAEQAGQPARRSQLVSCFP